MTPDLPLKKILYVDDADELRLMVRVILERLAGFQVKLCESGEEALREAAVFLPDLILLDVLMPGMDGPQTLQALRRNPSLAEVPVVFMTGQSSAVERQAHLQLGAIDVIPKPFNPAQLAATVEAIWSRYQAAKSRGNE